MTQQVSDCASRTRPSARPCWYFHKLYALDTVLPDLDRPSTAALEQAMKGHIMAQTQLVGTYQKGKN